MDTSEIKKKKKRKENDVKIETKDQKERDDQKSICVREQIKKKNE